MKLQYIGSHEEVVVPTDHSEIKCKKSKSAIFPDSLAKRLLEQKDNWKKGR